MIFYFIIKFNKNFNIIVTKIFERKKKKIFTIYKTNNKNLVIFENVWQNF